MKQIKMYLHDFAREQSWVSSYWNRVLPDLRDLGYTEFALYVEQRYHFRTIPQHRPWLGITPRQGEEAVRLCKKFGLKPYWFTNSFGHCDGLLANEAFRHLAEDIGEGEQLCPSHPETRPFLRTMLREFAELNRPEMLFIGGDEARALNRCERCRKRGLSDAELYLDHMKWVIRETKRLGKRPCIPGDMLLKHPHIIHEIDKDTIILDWHYDSGSEESLRLFQKHGFEILATTSTNEYWRNFYPFDQNRNCIEPFMREARQHHCMGMCMTGWEMIRGANLDTHWERVAGAIAAFEGDSLQNFSGKFCKRFFGTERCDQLRLKTFFNEKALAKLHPDFVTPNFRRQFGKTESAYLFYHMFGKGRARLAFQKLAPRIKASRPIIRDIMRAAKRRKHYFEFLDLPLDLFDVMHERIETLNFIRESADRLHPHRLPNATGTRLLRETLRKLWRHIENCEKLAKRYDRLKEAVGGTHIDPHRIRKQKGELRTLYGYIEYHAKTYAKGTPVPSREQWYV